ncbi:MAG: uroporphyrinogen-III C-methyltransferase [Burkholderiales bacterium]
MKQVSSGHVALVGAGPGDPELLTLKAVHMIRRATVVLADDLVSDAVLHFVRRSARIVHVGKRGGCASTPQAFIERLMAAEALKGERVVRLKGGDPFIFGRGGEEAEHLRAQGIEVEVVNGITSGLAAATALGAPLTHREHAHGVIFVTAHAREGGAPLDWNTLGAAAAQGLTLVIYMGVTAIESVQAGLLRSMPGQTPAAVVQSVSLPHQRHALCTLSTLAKTTRDEALASPSIIIVGNVLHGLQTLAQSRNHERAA